MADKQFTALRIWNDSRPIFDRIVDRLGINNVEAFDKMVKFFDLYKISPDTDFDNPTKQIQKGHDRLYKRIDDTIRIFRKSEELYAIPTLQRLDSLLDLMEMYIGDDFKPAQARAPRSAEMATPPPTPAAPAPVAEAPGQNQKIYELERSQRVMHEDLRHLLMNIEEQTSAAGAKTLKLKISSADLQALKKKYL